jgi:hypothetical protein
MTAYGLDDGQHAARWHNVARLLGAAGGGRQQTRINCVVQVLMQELRLLFCLFVVRLSCSGLQVV